jgi:hypothetical protein
MKMQTKKPGRRLFYRVTHILGAPFQCAFKCAQALITLPFNPTAAANLFLRSARIAGKAAESFAAGDQRNP